MDLITTMRKFFGFYLCLSSVGCMGLLIGDPHRYAYVTRKGNADAIGKWTMEQTDGQKIYDGLSALSERMGASRNKTEEQKAFDWFLQIMGKVEDWPSGRILSGESGEWTTHRLIQKTFSDVSIDSGHDPLLKELLRRLRPDDRHAYWLEAWEKCVAEQQRGPQQFPRTSATSAG